MKIKYYFWSLVFAAASLAFVSCSSDEGEETPTPTPVSELELNTTSMKIKVGSENRQKIDIKQGAGTYKAFAVDATVAQVSQDGENVYVTGLKNGVTDVVVSDAAGKYRKFPVSVYQYEKLAYEVAEGSDDPSADGNKTLVFTDKTFTVQLTQTNGNCSVKSDNENVTAEVDNDSGVITITAKGGIDPYEATLTVTDNVEVAPDMQIKVKLSSDLYYYDVYPDQKATDYNNTFSKYATNSRYSGYYFCGYMYLNGDYPDYRITQGYPVADTKNIYDVSHDGNHHKLHYTYTTPGPWYYNYKIISIEFDGAITEGAKYQGTFYGQYTYGPSSDELWYDSKVTASGSCCQVEIYKVNDQSKGKFAAMISYVDTGTQSVHRAWIIAPMP